MISNTTHKKSWRYTAGLTVGALGIVFGDIGTSPLYALRECFTGEHGILLSQENIFGILSLITWSLVMVISIKYLIFVMQADNKGEGGVLALMALAQKPLAQKPKTMQVVVMMGLFGSALLYGDGMITPAISVLSAVEGLAVAAPIFEHYTVGISILILILLFLPQSRGTAKVGAIFGPIIFVWFVILATLGVYNIGHYPQVIAALNPSYGFRFFIDNGFHGLAALGAVFLVVTGGEALYADMGHFGRLPIRLCWFLCVLPALLLNYFGQGALLLVNPAAISNPFFNMAPRWAVFPLVGLATAAAVIASQALISGAFSLTRQAVQLGYLPRTDIKHTSHHQIGQIYSPGVNWALLVCTIFLTLFFRSSSNLAAAYGIAVTLTMAITTMLMFFVSWYIWGYRLLPCIAFAVIFLTIDLSFIAANMIKVIGGGWFALLIGMLMLTVMTTWARGRKILALRMRKKSIPVDTYLTDLTKKPMTRVEGTAIYMTSNIDLTPFALVNNTIHNKVVHKHVILLMVQTADVPITNKHYQLEVAPLANGFWQVIACFGFMQTPDVSAILRKVFSMHPEIDATDLTYFVGRETLIPTDKPGMAIWRERLFALMSRNAQRATTYFNIPSKEVIEIGTQIEL